MSDVRTTGQRRIESEEVDILIREHLKGSGSGGPRVPVSWLNMVWATGGALMAALITIVSWGYRAGEVSQKIEARFIMDEARIAAVEAKMTDLYSRQASQDKEMRLLRDDVQEAVVTLRLIREAMKLPPIRQKGRVIDEE